MHEAIARALDDLPEWAHAPEVAFSSYGERGVIDILAFHARSHGIVIVMNAKDADFEAAATSLDALLATLQFDPAPSPSN